MRKLGELGGNLWGNLSPKHGNESALYSLRHEVQETTQAIVYRSWWLPRAGLGRLHGGEA